MTQLGVCLLTRNIKKVKSIIICSGETEDGEIDLEHAHPDPFVRSMALWKLKRYGEALDTLLNPAGRLHVARDGSTKDSNEPMPSVFNFYVYLRTHPRLKRHNLPSQVSNLVPFWSVRMHLMYWIAQKVLAWLKVNKAIFNRFFVCAHFNILGQVLRIGEKV